MTNPKIQPSRRGGELLIAIDRASPHPLIRQIEHQIRTGVRNGRLHPGSKLPSTRDLARQLGVSRPVIVEAFAQLGAEGYLDLRPNAVPRIADLPRQPDIRVGEPAESPRAPRFDFRPAIPDLSRFPRKEWAHAVAKATKSMTAEEFSYGERDGVAPLRVALAEYLGRVRGVAATADHVIITSGFEEGRLLACRTLRAAGISAIAAEDPSYSNWSFARETGLDVVPVPIDTEGLVVDRLAALDVQAVLVTPSHQFPTGAVLSGRRRIALTSWAAQKSATIIEDDYDAEFRYDRAPTGALQGIAPANVIYGGTASKILSPALRLGWLVVPDRLVDAIKAERVRLGYGCPRIDQHALADMLGSGAFERHLRGQRQVYSMRRAALLQALADYLPEAEVVGIEAGLHATVTLPDGYDEAAILKEAGRREIALDVLGPYRLTPTSGAATLLLGFARSSETSIRVGIQGLAAAIRDSRHGTA